MMKRFAPVLMLLLLLAPAVFAAEDLTGKWGGTLKVSMDGNPPRDTPAVLVLKQTGATLTGTAGPGEGEGEQMPLANGKVETVKKDGKDVTTVTFSVKDGHNDNAPAISFALTVVDGHLKGKAEAAMDGHTLVAVLDVARVK